MSRSSSTAVWSNNTQSGVVVAFKSLIHVQFPSWKWIREPEKAGLWCLDLEGADVDDVVSRYQQCAEPKPKVIFLSREFAVGPVSEWVYFRCPLNPGVLNAWVRANGLDVGEGAASNTVASPAPTENQSWRTHSFKLKKWPNTTDYSDSADVVFVCGGMIRDWHTIADVHELKVDFSILEKLLDDAQEEGNMEFDALHLDVEFNSSFVDLPDKKEPAPKSTGMWGRLKGLIGIS